MNFFLWKLGGQFFLSQSLPTLRIIHTRFGLIWSASWPDKKDLFLKFLIWKNRKFLYDKLIFFLGKLYKKFFCFTLSLYWWFPIQSCFTLNNSTRWNFFIFENRKVEKVDIFYWNTNFFLWKLGGPFFLSQSLPTPRILQTKFGLIWRTSWPDKRTYFKKFLFREIQKVPYEILTFFPRQAIQKIHFALHVNYTGDYP